MHLPPPGSGNEELDFQMAARGAQAAPYAEDPLDDVFGDDSDSPAFEESEGHHIRESHPSDVPRLQAEHTTAGYREGVTAAKALSIQAGFDEGFSLGATIGQMAGELLGLVEGLSGALRGRDDDASRRVHQLLADARRDLSTDAIFEPEYWATDGTWKYDVNGPGEEKDILFEHVARAHPMIKKWSSIVDEEILRWGVRRDVLAADNAPSSDNPNPKKEMQPVQSSKTALEW